ncbi:hypothetical protein [Methanolobus psychrotolerans]|uniref:hypothetical protein n=1 Tax=Methanolobus psychrotolerans TaxID=1874706 RepID=UPI000B916430|nr:hypothetical protein [Methanolobus psychrotolerans]
MIYPNIIYHPDSDTTVFIDTLQQIGNSASAEVVVYQSSLDASIKAFTGGLGARELTLVGKISSDNVDTLRRQLQYLRGKQVYLMLGAQNLATVARITNFDMPVAVGTYTPLTLDVVAESETEGQFWEAEDTTLTDGGGATVSASTTASGGSVVGITAQNGGCYETISQSDFVLPVGNYTAFARAKDANNITDDFELQLYNITEGGVHTASNETLASTYGMYTMDFTIDSSDAGDSLYLGVFKDKANVNFLIVDFFGFVRL